MISVAISLAVALLLMVAAPRILSHGTWAVHRPALALAMWFAAFFTACALFISAIATLVWLGIDRTTMTSNTEAPVFTIASWGTLGLVGGLIALVAQANEPLQQARDHERRQLAAAALDVEPRDGFTLVKVASDEAFACAVPGQRAQIMYSTALDELLTPPQLQAVIAHEYAHLRSFHPQLMRIATIAAKMLPRWVPAGREFRRATGLLIELMADDTAGKQAGAANLANALVQMSKATSDRSSEARAMRLTLREWPVGRRRRLPEQIRLHQL